MFDQNDQSQQAATTAPTVQSSAQNTTTLDLPDMTSTPDAVTAPAAIEPASNVTPLTPDPVSQQATVSTPTPEPTAITSSPVEPELTLPSKPAEISPTTGSSDLMSIKKDALQNLTPLLDHLDQTPDEKFRTTMMLIQASDDQSLVQAAYKAAQEITDEKVKAQALLDIINEINYFTQNTEAKTASTTV